MTKQTGTRHELTVRVLARASEYDAMHDAQENLPEEHLADISEARAELVGNDYAMLTIRTNAFFVDDLEQELLVPFAPCEFEMFEDGEGLVDGTTWEFSPNAMHGLLLGMGDDESVRLASPEEIMDVLRGRGIDKPWAGCPRG